MNRKELKIEIFRNDIPIPKLVEKIVISKKLCTRKSQDRAVSTKKKYQPLPTCLN